MPKYVSGLDGERLEVVGEADIFLWVRSPNRPEVRPWTVSAILVKPWADEPKVDEVWEHSNYGYKVVVKSVADPEYVVYNFANDFEYPHVKTMREFLASFEVSH